MSTPFEVAIGIAVVTVVCAATVAGRRPHARVRERVVSAVVSLAAFALVVGLYRTDKIGDRALGITLVASVVMTSLLDLIIGHRLRGDRSRPSDSHGT